MEMKIRLLTRWVRELKKAKKGYYCLKTTKGEECCLGVLARMEGVPCIKSNPEQVSHYFPDGESRYAHRFDFGDDGKKSRRLSSEFRKKVGMSTRLECQLIHLNDKNDTFGPVIKKLEKVLEAVRKKK